MRESGPDVIASIVKSTGCGFSCRRLCLSSSLGVQTKRVLYVNQVDVDISRLDNGRQCRRMKQQVVWRPFVASKEVEEKAGKQLYVCVCQYRANESPGKWQSAGRQTLKTWLL